MNTNPLKPPDTAAAATPATQPFPTTTGSATAAASPTPNPAGPDILTQIWSGPLGFQIGSTTSASLDFEGPRPRSSANISDGNVWAHQYFYGASYEILGSGGSVVALLTEARTPTAAQCRDYADSNGGGAVKVTEKNQGQGLCIRVGKGPRYVWFRLS